MHFSASNEQILISARNVLLDCCGQSISWQPTNQPDVAAPPPHAHRVLLHWKRRGRRRRSCRPPHDHCLGPSPRLPRWARKQRQRPAPHPRSRVWHCRKDRLLADWTTGEFIPLDLIQWRCRIYPRDVLEPHPCHQVSRVISQHVIPIYPRDVVEFIHVTLSNQRDVFEFISLMLSDLST